MYPLLPVCTPSEDTGTISKVLYDPPDIPALNFSTKVACASLKSSPVFSFGYHLRFWRFEMKDFKLLSEGSYLAILITAISSFFIPLEIAASTILLMLLKALLIAVLDGLSA